MRSAVEDVQGKNKESSTPKEPTSLEIEEEIEEQIKRVEKAKQDKVQRFQKIQAEAARLQKDVEAVRWNFYKQKAAEDSLNATKVSTGELIETVGSRTGKERRR